MAERLTRPVYEFRPMLGFFKGPFHRYANGEWLPDDGEYDLAFATVEAGSICLFFEHPHPRNLEWSWLTTDWRQNVAEHPRGGNPWHRALREGADDFGKGWGRETHPNEIAGRSGMNWACSQRSCANGRHVECSPLDPHIRAGLVRDRATKVILAPPSGLVCMYCGQPPRQALRTSDGGNDA